MTDRTELAQLQKLSLESHLDELARLPEPEQSALTNATAKTLARTARHFVPLWMNLCSNFRFARASHVARTFQVPRLDGKQVAVSSTTATQAYMLDQYLAKNCPGTEIQPVVIAGSGNRVAALLAGQIAATPVDFANYLALQRKGEKNFRVMAFFRKSFRDCGEPDKW